MANKITIIGSGQVGASIAYALSLKGTATEIVLLDIAVDRAKGEAMDIRQGTPYMSPVNIHQGDYNDAKDSNIVVISSGVARKPGQSRLELAQTNVNIMKSIIPQITKSCPNAIYVLVANPVDILTYQFAKTSGIPANHILGTGTLLDTARLRTRLADDCGVAQSNVHAYVFGEHGDSSFVAWSHANIATIPVDSYPVKVDKDGIEDYVRKSGGIIIAAKGCTNYAIGVTTAQVCEAVKNANTSITVATTLLDGEYGIKDVALSILTKLGGNGIQGHIEAPLNDAELASLTHSANCLKDVIKQLEF